MKKKMTRMEEATAELRTQLTIRTWLIGILGLMMVAITGFNITFLF